MAILFRYVYSNHACDYGLTVVKFNLYLIFIADLNRELTKLKPAKRVG